MMANVDHSSPPSADCEAKTSTIEPRPRLERDFSPSSLDWLLSRTRDKLFGADAEPRSIGRYLVIEPLGSGGMGIVYEAFDPTLDRPVAIKVLRHRLHSSQSERLVREARALARLSHPNVVQVYEADHLEDQSFVVMQLVRGQTLRQWQADSPATDWRARVEAYLQAGAGLAAAHEQGLVHRDFKPSNAMIDDEGHVRVLDFGIARALVDATTTTSNGSDPSRPDNADSNNARPNNSESDNAESDNAESDNARPDDSESDDSLRKGAATPRLTETGCVIGTLAYMSLEQMQGKLVDDQSDQFSFCVALYEAIYGTRPFAGKTIEVLEQALEQGPAPAPPAGSTAPAALHSILVRGLAPRPEDRWPSMEALLDRLDRLVHPPARRLWSTRATTLAVGMLLTGGALAYGTNSGPLCTGAPAALEGIWDDSRKESIQPAWADAPPTVGAWIETHLDQYAHAWIQAHRSNCEATRITTEQSEEVMDLRMACLDDRRRHLAAAVATLSRASLEAEPPGVYRLMDVVDGLPPLSTCNTVDQLRRQQERIPPPDDPATAAEVQTLREHLAKLEYELKIGRREAVLTQLPPIMERARALGYPPLVAEATWVRGRAYKINAQYERAEQDLAEAYTLAVEHGHLEVATNAAMRLADLVGVSRGRYDEGAVWAREAVSMATWFGQTRAQVDSMVSLGSIRSEQGQGEQAQSWLGQAIELGETSLGPDHPSVARARERMGTFLGRQGRYAEAEREFRRALEIRQRHYGQEHVGVANNLSSIGVSLTGQGRNADAEPMLRRAVAMHTRLLGPDHPDLA
ncbi:MAG: serine/threonine-protein kinase, partial [Myxococcota bacterium]